MKYYHTKSKVRNMNNLVSNVNVNKILRFSYPSVMLQQMLSRPLRDNYVFWGGKLIQKHLGPSFLIVQTSFWFLEANKLKKWMYLFLFLRPVIHSVKLPPMYYVQFSLKLPNKLVTFYNVKNRSWLNHERIQKFVVSLVSSLNNKLTLF